LAFCSRKVGCFNDFDIPGNFFGSSSKFIEAHRGACEVLNMT
jgi:hypothetical protein